MWRYQSIKWDWKIAVLKWHLGLPGANELSDCIPIYYHHLVISTDHCQSYIISCIIDFILPLVIIPLLVLITFIEFIITMFLSVSPVNDDVLSSHSRSRFLWMKQWLCPVMSQIHCWSMVSFALDIRKKKVNGLVQERHNSIANALELRLSCTNPSMCQVSWKFKGW